jgi:hypothetical protein
MLLVSVYNVHFSLYLFGEVEFTDRIKVEGDLVSINHIIMAVDSHYFTII